MHIAHRSTLLNCTIGCHRRNRYFHEWMGTTSTHKTFKGSLLTELICPVMNTIDAELSADNGKRRGPRVSRCNLVSASIASLVAPLQPYFGSPRFVSYSARVSACKFVAFARQLDSARLTTLALENKFHFLSFFIADILSCFYCVYIFKSIFPSALLIFLFGGFIFMHYPFITVFIWIQFLSMFAFRATQNEVHWMKFPCLSTMKLFITQREGLA